METDNPYSAPDSDNLTKAESGQMVRLSKISVFQTSKVVSLVYIVFGIPHAIAGIFFLAFASGPERWMGLMFLCMPVIMYIMGFIGMAICSALYNFIASKLGGIEFQLTPNEN